MGARRRQASKSRGGDRLRTSGRFCRFCRWVSEAFLSHRRAHLPVTGHATGHTPSEWCQLYPMYPNVHPNAANHTPTESASMTQHTPNTQTHSAVTKRSQTPAGELQNRCTAACAVVGGFDSHTPLPRIHGACARARPSTRARADNIRPTSMATSAGFLQMMTNAPPEVDPIKDNVHSRKSAKSSLGCADNAFA